MDINACDICPKRYYTKYTLIYEIVHVFNRFHVLLHMKMYLIYIHTYMHIVTISTRDTRRREVSFNITVFN